MFVDIHTHHTSTLDIPSIRNLAFANAEHIFSSKEEGLFSIGFHPWHADEFSTELLAKLTSWVQDRRLIALGECGLDKNSKVSFKQQLLVFEQQISLSEKIKKPLIIHCVGYFNELLEIKKQWRPTQIWIIHGFRGKPQLAEQILNSGCSLSFGEHYNAESVKATPFDKLFIETDESTQSIQEIYNQIALTKLCNLEDLNAGYRFLCSRIEQHRI